MIRTTCPQCGREDAIADYLASLPVMCKSCGHRVTMGEPIAPTKPVLAPPPAPKPVPPPPTPKPAPLPPPVVAVSPPPPPKPKPEPAAVVHTVSHAASHPLPADSPLNLNEWPADQPTVPLNVRASFANAVGPGMVDLFDDVPVPESRTERPPLPTPPPQFTTLTTGLHRGRRFAARLVTLAGAVLALFAGIMLAAFAPNVVKNDPRMHTAFLFVPFALYVLYNVVLLAKHGQDFGKRALKLRVVADDGTPAGFGRAFLRRELVVILLLVGIVPLAWKLYQMQKAGDLTGQWQRAGWQMFLPNRMKEVLPAVVAVLFSALNALMIFNKDGKCIHDRLAKTRVNRA